MLTKHRANGWKPYSKKFTDKMRGTSASRGYGHRWRVARAEFLKEHPLCVSCLEDNKTSPSNVVDHITPHKGDGKLFWFRDNWQALCSTCHNSKTAKEDGGFGNTGGRGQKFTA